MCCGFCTSTTWIDVLSAFSAIAAVIAAIAAVCGNRQSQKQFVKNVELQNKAINLTLFDKRMEYFDLVKRGDYSFDRDRFSLLFSDEISQQITQVIQKADKVTEIESMRNRLVEALENDNINDIIDPTLRMGGIIRKFNMYKGENYDECSQKDYYRIKDVLDKERRLISKGDGMAGSYTYPELYDELEKATNGLKKSKENLIKNVELFIKSSIGNVGVNGL